MMVSRQGHHAGRLQAAVGRDCRPAQQIVQPPGSGGAAIRMPKRMTSMGVGMAALVATNRNDEGRAPARRTGGALAVIKENCIYRRL